jgi:hypothetical protein
VIYCRGLQPSSCAGVYPFHAMAALRVSQRNQVRGWVEGAGLDPSAFSWAHGEDGSKLSHEPTGHWLRVNMEAGGQVELGFLPSLAGLAPGQTRVNGFDAIEEQVVTWLGWVADDSVPDLWAEIPFAGGRFAEWDGPDQNEPLSVPEKAEVKRRIEAGRQVLLDAGLDEEAMAAADEKLEQIVEATERLGRFDWRYFAFGRMVDIAIGAALAAPQVQRFLGAVFDQAIKLIGAG